MAYNDFNDRENVYEIMKTTLYRYFDGNVEFYNKKKFGKVDSSNLFYCFPRINAIVPLNKSNNIKRFIQSDNRITYDFSKKIIMDVYTFCVFNFPKIFAEKILEVEQIELANPDLLIYPGNKKIKVMNFKTNTIDNILKEKFSSSWFDKEIEMRKNPKWNFVLPLTLINDGIYRERLVKGYAFTRATKSEKEFFSPIVKDYVEILQSNSEEKLIGEYSADLLKIIHQELYRLKKNISKFDIENLEIFLVNVSIALKNSRESLKVTFSHGDLQEGNIFIESTTKKLWILDWETWGTRSENYDIFLLFYNMRNSNKLIQNLESIYNDKGRKVTKDSNKELSLNTKITIFILEDIIWQIEESKVLPGNSIANGLKVYMKRDIQNTILKLMAREVEGDR